jgi:uncharacterized protein YeaO (DUF488 family)
MIAIKRAYEEAARADGTRILVERLWPRGVKKDQLRLDGWAKEVAPSAALRTWYGHDVSKWAEFQKRYRAELKANPAALAPLLAAARTGRLTLVYAARDEEHNSAVVLRQVLEKKL